MRTPAVAAAAILLLAGCTPSEDPGEEESASPSASASPSVSASQAAVDDLEAACDALGEAVTLPGGDAVEYTVAFDDPRGPADNVPVCDIEPEGEYYDVAAAAGLFGRAEFDYGIADLPLEGWTGKKWDPERAQDLLTLDQVEPLHDDVPCANEPCENDIHGYFYNFRIETLMDDIVVQARIDYITTDVSGDQQDEYREQAIAAFTASMDIIAAELH